MKKGPVQCTPDLVKRPVHIDVIGYAWQSGTVRR